MKTQPKLFPEVMRLLRVEIALRQAGQHMAADMARKERLDILDRILGLNRVNPI